MTNGGPTGGVPSAVEKGVIYMDRLGIYVGEKIPEPKAKRNRRWVTHLGYSVVD